MYIIGERLNGMFKDVRKAIQERHKPVIHDLALSQIAGGAQALDLNIGPASDKPVEAMQWLVDTVREVSQAPLCIDSPKWEVQQAIIPRIAGKAIINSSKADEADLDRAIGLAVKHRASVICLTLDQKGVPTNVERRVELGAFIASKAVEAGLPMDHLFIDPVILPVNVSPATPGHVMQALSQLKVINDPMPHLVLGLSNVSQGCSERKLINRTFAVMAITAGMDAAILDPLDAALMNAVITSQLLSQKTIYCESFLDAYKMQHQPDR